MRKHIAAALAVTLAISAFAFPSTAYASGTATMDVSVTLTEDDVTPPSSEPPDNPPEDDPEPSGPDYVVHIPASTSLDDQTDGDMTTASGEVVLTWENYNLTGQDSVEVFIDGAKTFPDGLFYLTTGDGSTERQKISCFITCSSPEAPYGNGVNGPEDATVAYFTASYDSAYPMTGGLLRFNTQAGPFYSNESGTYTGTIHFRIVFSPGFH